MTPSRRQIDPWALSGVLFAAFFIVGVVLGGVLASTTLPLPGAPAAEVARYYDDSRTAVLVLSLFQVLSAVLLFVFVASVATFARSTAGERRALPGLTSGGGALAAAFLLVSALLGWVLALTAGGLGLDLVGTLRSLNFLSGGTLHVASLGLFMGAASIAALRAKALPRWIPWLGIVAAALSILSLASLVLFPASVLIPLGRLLAFVWSIAVGLVLALGKRHQPDAGVISLFSRNKRGERRVSPPVYKLLLAAHIIVSVGWLGIVFAKLVLGLAAVRSGAPEVSDALYLSMEVVNLAFPPAAIGTIVTGVLLSLGTKWGLLQHYWVATKLA